MIASSGGKPRTNITAHSVRATMEHAVIYWLTVHFLPVILMRLARFSGLGTSDTSIFISLPGCRFEMTLRIRASISASVEPL